MNHSKALPLILEWRTFILFFFYFFYILISLQRTVWTLVASWKFRYGCDSSALGLNSPFLPLSLSFLFSLSQGNEGVVFSHSVETSHVRAQPFQDLKWVIQNWAFIYLIIQYNISTSQLKRRKKNNPINNICPWTQRNKFPLS